MAISEQKVSIVGIFKIFFAIMVVAIHTHAGAEFGAEGLLFTYIFEFTVLYSFIANGYLLVKKQQMRKD